MEPITSQDYYVEIAELARDIVEREEYDREKASDSVHETVDGHQWIIYTYYNLQVLTHSTNDNAYFDNFGPLQADGFSDAVQKMAFAAMAQDLGEAVEEALREHEERQQAGDDEANAG